jgi:hypothetical protein
MLKPDHIRYKTACHYLHRPLGEGWGKGAQLARSLEQTIAGNGAKILEA